MSDLLPMYL